LEVKTPAPKHSHGFSSARRTEACGNFLTQPEVHIMATEPNSHLRFCWQRLGSPGPWCGMSCWRAQRNKNT